MGLVHVVVCAVGSLDYMQVSIKRPLEFLKDGAHRKPRSLYNLLDRDYGDSMGDYMRIGMPLASFQKLLRIWSDWSSYFVFRPTKTGLFDNQIDEAHISLRQFFLTHTNFSIFEVEGEWKQRIGFKISDFNQQIKEFLNDGVTLAEVLGKLSEAEKKQLKKKLCVILETNGSDEFSVKLTRSKTQQNGQEIFRLENTEIGSEERCPIPKIEGAVSLNITPSVFGKVCDAVQALSDYVLMYTLPNDRDTLHFYAESDGGKVDVDVPVRYRTFGELHSIYALSYLKSIACMSPLTEKLRLEMSSDMPLIARLLLKNRGYMLFAVAPRIEGGE